MTDTYTLDFQHWLTEFPRSRIVAQSERDGYWNPEASHITSPVDLVIAEQLRQQNRHALDASRTVPCDVFVWALGEPDRRDVTKVGGAPYRPADKPWPTKDGARYTFLAQFDFSASRDVIGPTPSDTLLVFTLESNLSDFDDLYFEWYKKGISDLIDPTSVAETCFPFVTCYGERHRTADYPDAVRDTGDFGLCVLAGTKIGGVPHFNVVGLGWDEQRMQPRELVTDLDQLVEGRFLCCLGAVQPNPHFEYPFTNLRECLTLDHCGDDDKTLSLVDMGSIFFYLTETGEINHWFQCS